MADKQKIAVLGAGNVGGTLGRKWVAMWSMEWGGSGSPSPSAKNEERISRSNS